ncbi:MAG: methylenetetrahydrofolate--tRNA-(uracil(54)-C(5))-methyltransferase (FADH(2)-oxidizing) TrmFO [Bdellovibrionota bacterium]
MKVRVIGAGLAGSEAAWQLAKRGISVEIHEMRPATMTKAHRTGKCAELVCSNSFRGADLSNAVGLLKEELKLLGSLVMESALHSQVPAGGALAVDRELFSELVDQRLRTHPLIRFVEGEAQSVPAATPSEPVIVATGPLTSPTLAKSIEQLTGEGRLSFFDAISPVILDESIDHTKIFRQSRYDKGGDDYLNIPLSKEQYYKFVEDVAAGEKFGGHQEVESDSIENLRPFEGCMPIEDMIDRGPDTLLFGPFKAVGLRDPSTGLRPYAVCQLRQDDKSGKLWSMVGMQTRLKHPEQLRIFRTLPGLEEAEFVRLGSVHRNSFINSPNCLDATLQFRGRPGLFFAGQITGVEGYVESTAGGMLAGMNVARMIAGEELLTFPVETALGALMAYISEPTRKDFQPMNISFGLMPSYLDSERRDAGGKKIAKKDRRTASSLKALELVREIAGIPSAEMGEQVQGVAQAL